MLKSENVATPFAALAAVVPESIPPPGLFRIAAVTLCVAAVTVLPNASWTATWTAGLIAPPDRVARGWITKASCDAAPAVMANGALVALVRPLAEAPSLEPGPALAVLRVAKVAAPSPA